MESWDGKTTVTETDDPTVVELQDEALMIIRENWETKLAIDAAVEELYELELKLMQLKVDKMWEPLKDLPPKNLMPINVWLNYFYVTALLRVNSWKIKIFNKRFSN